MDIAKIRKKSKETPPVASREEYHPLHEAAASEEGGVSIAERQTGTEEGRAAALPERIVDETTVELLTFSLAEEVFSFRIQEIQEIIKPQKMTTIPKAASHLIGITSLRGKIIPVVDLQKKLSLPGEGEKSKQKILVLNGPKGSIGALVDRVIGVIRPLIAEIGETPPHLLETETKFIDGVVLVGEKFVSIIKTEEALTI